MYYIQKYYYYYEGTQGAPKDGPMKDTWGDTIEFDCLEEAKEFIVWDCGTNLMTIGENRYQSTGIYDLRHGEYDRPDYEIRKLDQSSEPTSHGRICFSDEELPTIGFRGNKKIIIPKGE